VVVGGESAGAVLALYLASMYPEVAAILAYAPALRLKIRRREIVRLRFAALFRPHLPKRNFRHDPLWQGYPVYPLRGAVELLRLQRATEARLSAICQPLFIAQGRLDETVDPRVPELLVKKTRSQIKAVYWMESSAHCVILDREREQVAELTVQFLDRVLA
jgi:esterase/lipase